MRWCRRWGRKSTAFLYPNKEANSHALLLFFWLKETSMPPSTAERFHRTARCSWNISNSPPSVETNQSAVQPVPLKVYFTCTREIKQTIWAPEERILWVGSGRTESIKTRLAVSCLWFNLLCQPVPALLKCPLAKHWTLISCSTAGLTSNLPVYLSQGLTCLVSIKLN